MRSELVPGISAMLNPTPDQELIMTHDQLLSIQALLNDVAGLSSPTLAEEISAISQELLLLEGKAFRQIWHHFIERKRYQYGDSSF